MEAIILAGGLGTRMREETDFRPKPMVEVGGRPVLWHILKHLSTHGVNCFVVALGYKGEMIRDYFLKDESLASDRGWRSGYVETVKVHDEDRGTPWTVTLVDTGLSTNTGGRVKQAAEFTSGSDVLMAYGDTLADVDVSGLERHHRQSGAEVTVTAVQPISRFGVLELAQGGRVREFVEKPRMREWVSIGHMMMSKQFIDALPDNAVLEEQPMAQVAATGKMYAFRHEGFWQPMDTYREYVELNRLWDEGHPPWKTW